MINNLYNPAFIFILAALTLPFVTGKLRAAVLLAAPLGGLALLITLGMGSSSVMLMGYELTPLRIDKLSFIFAIAFHIAALFSVIYSLHIKDKLQDVAGLLYMGAAIGACLAGDLLSLFVWWELTAISSVFLIWARRTETSYRAGMRYLIIQVSSGVLLAAGAVIYARATGNLDFLHIGLDSPAGLLIFIAFGIKAAFPLLHNWLQDAYPKATVTGTVVLSAFTTKLAIYALARGFAGESSLIWIGCIMTAFPILFAVIENDLRKVLAYSLNNQLGFMVVGIGIGTELAINGAAAHAFAHIMYKGLLFMSMGAVLHRVGTIKASELGGLYKSMPITAMLCIIGSMSISAFPFFSGFVTKSMIMTAAAEQHMWLVYLTLLLASAGVLDHSGIKIPFFSFFAHDQGLRCQEAPSNMLVAMFICAFLCIGIGVYPAPLYALLPYAVDYNAYSATHVVTQYQLLFAAMLGFAVLWRKGWYPAEIPSLNLDSDWVYRKLIPTIWGAVLSTLGQVKEAWDNFISQSWGNLQHWMKQEMGPKAPIGSNFSTSSSMLGIVALLGVVCCIGLFFGG